jgi:hypothetical protein
MGKPSVSKAVRGWFQHDGTPSRPYLLVLAPVTCVITWTTLGGDHSQGFICLFTHTDSCE